MIRATITHLGAFAVCREKYATKLFQRKIVIAWLILSRRTLLRGSIRCGWFLSLITPVTT